MAIGDAQAIETPSLAPVPRPVTVGWFVKRSLVGIAILLVAMGGLAWLTYASIDPDLDIDATAAPTSANEEPPARLTPVDL